MCMILVLHFIVVRMLEYCFACDILQSVCCACATQLYICAQLVEVACWLYFAEQYVDSMLCRCLQCLIWLLCCVAFW